MYESAWWLRAIGVLYMRVPRLAGDFSLFSLALAVRRSHAFAAALHLGQRVFPRAERARTRHLHHRYLLYIFGATETRFRKVHLQLAKVGVGGWVGDVFLSWFSRESGILVSLFLLVFGAAHVTPTAPEDARAAARVSRRIHSRFSPEFEFEGIPRAYNKPIDIYRQIVFSFPRARSRKNIELKTGLARCIDSCQLTLAELRA